MTEAEKNSLYERVGQVFVPAAPVSEWEFFAGRSQQLRCIIDATNQVGQHAIVFGERGVGKTSLANVLATRLQASDADARVIAPRINCDSTDTFQSVWHKIFDHVAVQQATHPAGFTTEAPPQLVQASKALTEAPTPNEILKLLILLSSPHNKAEIMIILDEFDRVTDQSVRRAIADTIKALSDYMVPVTIVLVGVADSVTDLITEHQSIERALVQVQMPRMSPDEIQEILDTRLRLLEMGMDQETKNRICFIAQGLPYYAHLLGQHATRKALSCMSKNVTPDHLRRALQQAVSGAQQSLQRAYDQATRNPRQKNIYPQVLLACALAKTDTFGYFAAADVREPMNKVTQRTYPIGGFKKNLDDFTKPGRGAILQRTGTKRNHRYRFEDPLLPSLTIMKALVDEQINMGTVQGISPQPETWEFVT